MCLDETGGGKGDLQEETAQPFWQHPFDALGGTSGPQKAPHLKDSLRRTCNHLDLLMVTPLLGKVIPVV